MKWWMKSKTVLASLVIGLTGVWKIVKPESPLPEAILFIAGAVGLIGQRQATQRAIDAAKDK